MSKKKAALFCLAAWMGLNLWHASAIPLLADEMYYAAWAQHPSWSYFDHPPLIAWLIRAGQMLVAGQLGVRLPALVCHLGTLLWAWHILGDAKKLTHWLLLGVATLLFHASALLAVPDSPYLLGCTAFLAFYRQFLRNARGASTLGMAFSAAWMVCSKYHGWIFLGLVLAPNALFFVQQFKRTLPAFFLFFVLIAPVYIPAARQGFETLAVHLGGRQVANPFPRSTLDFLGGWLLSTGFWLYPVGVYWVLSRKPTDKFQWSLVSVAVGFPLLVGGISLFSSVEANWPAPALLALLLSLVEEKWPFRHPPKRILGALIPLWCGVLGLRIVSAARPELLASWRPLDFSPPSAWVDPVRQAAGHAPVVFLNSYQMAAAYSWHTGLKAFSLNNFNYRRNQYDIWQWDTASWDKPVYLVSSWPFPGMTQVTDTPFDLYGISLKHFFALPQLTLRWSEPSQRLRPGHYVEGQLLVKNTYLKDVPESFKTAGFHVLVTFWEDGRRVDSAEQYIPLPEDLFPFKSQAIREFPIRFCAPKKPGEYRVNFCLRTGWLESGYNSPFYFVKVL
ncbi:MAG: glycosyltransferase family 39 protein [Flavobacteriales bacterium]|nr:glycosyltransferase family 39 protein [Flavobacteriales bacterium]MDW8432536.1 hypothetical protein [Flavobacteriales bacterium]